MGFLLSSSFIVVVTLLGCADRGRDACQVDADCDDGNPCTGLEACTGQGACARGTPLSCAEPDVCTVVDGPAEGRAAVCDALCDLPRAPVLPWLRQGESLRFVADDAAIEIAVDEGPFSLGADLVAPQADGPLRVRARVPGAACTFDHTYQVRPSWPGAARTEGSVAVPADDPRITGWATGIAEAVWGEAVDPAWQDPAQALGPVGGAAIGVASLGRGGWLTVTFDPPLLQGDGPELAVFENGFSDTFLELAHVEVSSDGSVFARFDSAADTPEPVGPFGETDPSRVAGLAGDVRARFGTPFDLADLRFDPLVRAGQVDLTRITHVRVVDVVGDGSDHDSWGRPIHDPFPTVGSAGFDLDAVARVEGPW